MYKIALCGKANTGKNTTGEIIQKELASYHNIDSLNHKFFAFADPIKEIAKTMFPKIKKNHLYGPSKFRNTVIEGAKDKEGNPLTIRRLLLDIGTEVGRAYCDSVWLNNMGERLIKAERYNKQAAIITDVRFKNEFDWLKGLGFFLIKVERENETKIAHISETNQDLIKNSDYDFTINNNGNLEELVEIIRLNLLPTLTKTQKYV